MSNGYPVYGAAGTLRAIAFDLDKNDPMVWTIDTGRLRPVMTTAFGAAKAIISNDGTPRRAQ